MPAYNAEKYISQAIESVLAQTFRDFELIIRDDRSTDSTWNIIRDYAMKDGRIRAGRNGMNMGVSPTRNLLIREATAPYVAWQDADDISLPRRIQAQYEYMERNPDVAIVGAYLQMIDADGHKLSVRTYSEHDHEIRKKIFKYSPVSQPVAMIRKGVLDSSGYFDEKLAQAEDLDLSFRIGTLGKFANIQEPLLLYRYHASSISAGKLKENIGCTLEVRRRAEQKYGYRMTVTDRLAYAAAWASQYLPSSFVQGAFSALRGLFEKQR